jgi:hypothetical protein
LVARDPKPASSNSKCLRKPDLKNHLTESIANETDQYGLDERLNQLLIRITVNITYKDKEKYVGEN